MTVREACDLAVLSQAGAVSVQRAGPGPTGPECERVGTGAAGPAVSD